MVDAGLEAFFGTVPFLGSGSSNSSADKQPNLSKSPDRPDRFFFLGIDRLAGRADVDLDADAGLDDEAAGVVDFSVVIAFGSPLAFSVAMALEAVLFVVVEASFDPTAAASPALSSWTSAGIGRGWANECEGCMGVLGVAGVTTNSGGPCDCALDDDEAIADASFGRVVIGGVVVIALFV